MMGVRKTIVASETPHYVQVLKLTLRHFRDIELKVKLRLAIIVDQEKWQGLTALDE